MNTLIETTERVAAARIGLRIGDALAMPVHWYYNRLALLEDYGVVTDFLPPKHPHPDSILWRSSWKAPSRELDILGAERSVWGERGIHYHRHLEAGENTLTAKIADQVWESLVTHQGYVASDFLERYVGLLTAPTRHRDTYVEEAHRGFFTNLGRGRRLEKCGLPGKHIGGLVTMLPVALFYADREEEGRVRTLEHLSLTHAGEKMRIAAEAILSLLFPVLAGRLTLEEAIREECRSQRNPHFGYPFSKWLDLRDEQVIGPKLSKACYIEDAVPAVIYLALKYSRDPEKALVANTNLGGDNVHRGSVLGTLLGAENGIEGWPPRWLEGLREKPVA